MQCKCIDPKAGKKPACGSPKYKGDGVCDDNNNNKDCDYDGGDCCAKTVKGGKLKTKFCKKVTCGTGVVLVISFCYIFILLDN